MHTSRCSYPCACKSLQCARRCALARKDTVASAGKNRGGKNTRKQCSICKQMGRDGHGHRRSNCPWAKPGEMDKASSKADARAKEKEKRPASREAQVGATCHVQALAAHTCAPLLLTHVTQSDAANCS